MFVSFVLRYDLFQFFIKTIAITPRACIQIPESRRYKKRYKEKLYISRRCSLQEFLVTQENCVAVAKFSLRSKFVIMQNNCSQNASTTYIQPVCQNRQQNRKSQIRILTLLSQKSWVLAFKKYLKSMWHRILRSGLFRFMESTIILYSPIFNWTG